MPIQRLADIAAAHASLTALASMAAAFDPRTPISKRALPQDFAALLRGIAAQLEAGMEAIMREDPEPPAEAEAPHLVAVPPARTDGA